MEQASPRSFLDFEVGVFNGKYVTPVDDAYIARLEQVRRQSRKLESAKTSDTQDSISYREIYSAYVNPDGQLS